MTKFFLAIFHFFNKHRIIFWSVLGSTTLLFGVFAAQIHFEEDLLALLPKTEKSIECAVAFDDIKIKDKAFIIMSSPDGSLSPEDLTVKMDSFMEYLYDCDKETGFIANTLYKFDQDDIMNLIDYGMNALPCHLGADYYKALDTLLCEKTFDQVASGKSPVQLPAMEGSTIINWHIFSPDSTLALCYVSPTFNMIESKISSDFEIMLRKAVKTFEAENPGCKISYHGAPFEAAFNSLQVKKDLVLTVGLSLLLICILIAVCFSSKKTLVALVAPVIYGTLFSLAVIYWIKGTMSFISIGIGALVLGVALSYCLHVLTHRKYVSNIEQIIKEQARPVCLGCITTIGAFAGLLFTSSELLSDFGLFASLAMVGTTFFALAFLPQFFKDGESPKNEKAFDIINKINQYPIDKNIFFVSLLVIFSVVCIYLSPKVEFNQDLGCIDYREPKVVASEKSYNSHVNGTYYPMYYAVQADELDSAIFYSRILNRKLDTLQAEGIIHSYSSIEGLLLTEEEQLNNIDLWKNYWTPDKIRKTKALLKKEAEKYNWDTGGIDVADTFEAMALADYEPVSLCEYGAVPEALLCNFIEQNPSGWLIFSTVTLDRDEMYHINDYVADMPHVVVMDPFYYAGDMVQIAHDDFNVVLLISSLFVFLVLLVSFRSLIISLIAFMPMALSWYIVQGAMVLIGVDFNIINIMVSSFIFGIGVDYSIFVMEGLINNAKFNNQRLLVCHKAAIFFSGVTLIVVMVSLLFAKHPAIHSTGVCTIIGMTSTILITYTLQPILFRWVMKSKFLRKHSLHEKDSDNIDASC